MLLIPGIQYDLRAPQCKCQSSVNGVKQPPRAYLRSDEDDNVQEGGGGLRKFYRDESRVERGGGQGGGKSCGLLEIISTEGDARAQPPGEL
ncbi:hypothetical protein RRG08_034600 [Elysia crispata]|uniref:Uncharacterized protein n=1 Tax=Elysia crispata TaxID=231223 RepID=A0AAE1B1D3_9GAST|nr:hypothetical protein RRG08_034600 [Elysia crispata]